MPLFEAHDLQKTYYGEGTDTKVLRGLTFTVEHGEFVSIMGPSGSGKSTLLHILGFLDRHTDGECKFDGRRYQNFTEDEAAHVRNREIGFVFQQFNLLPRQTVYENVQLPLMYSDTPEQAWDARVKEVVELVELSHRLDYEAYKLSGGEMQRATIARALINNPHVIFADEPTGNLDSKSGQVVMETLRKLHDELGHTIILITHETFVAEHAERIMYIKDGVIEKDEAVTRKGSVRKAHPKKES